MNPLTSLPSDSVYCSNCESVISQSARYCPNCGCYQNYLFEQKQREQREKQWQYLKGIIIFYAVYLMTIIPIFWFKNIESKTKALFVVSILDVFVIMIFWYQTKHPLLPQLKITPKVLKYSLISMIILIPVISLNFFYHSLLIKIFNLDVSLQVGPFIEAGYGMIVIILFSCIMPAICEEIAFRGLIQPRLAIIFSKKRAILITAALFAVIHVALLSWPYLFLFGIILGLSRYYSNSLWPGILLHFLHNLIVVLNEMFWHIS